MIKYLSKVGSKKLGQTAVVRLDFNTEDDWRMATAIPTLKFLIKNGCKVLVLSHKGRPNSIEKKSSLKKDSEKLARLLGKKVRFIPHFRFSEIKREIQEAPRGSVFVLENIRFLKGEGSNDLKLAKDLAGLGDFYVNEAFAVSHRAAASVLAITQFLPSYAGLGLEQEITHLTRVMKSPVRPLLLIVGGGKASDKVELIKFFNKKADTILTGGAAANTLLLTSGYDIKKSLADREGAKSFRPILKYKNLVLPIDYGVSGDKILDIGPKTVEFYVSRIEKAKTIIWNGPMGFVEKKPFDRGTLAITKAIVKNKRCFSVTGGGETVEFLKKHRLDKGFSFISTGGGAMLDFLAGKTLPGLKALEGSLKFKSQNEK
ncbi:MAG: phosphoglycerate kinase [Patescibacteria group bacterium]|mgnify:CR=1 FL=1